MVHHARDRSRLWLSVVCLLCTFCLQVKSQDVESIGSNLRNIKTQQVGVGGGITLNSHFYTSNDIDPRRDPFQWSAMANINFNFMGISAPFTFMFSDGNQRFNLPSYAFTGISPTYKWATLHAGDRNMYFSRYTLSNLNFRGGGVELTPGRWTIKTMYGRLRKAEAEDLTARQSLDPAYERKAWGALVGYAHPTYSISAVVFKASEDENSIDAPVNFDITPADNAVLSVFGRKSFGQHFTLDADAARSAYNEDVRAGDADDQIDGVEHSLLGLFKPTNSSVFGNAFNVGLTYAKSLYSIRLGTEKVDRGFQSLGSLFFNNDLLHYTASINTSLFKRKVTLGLRGGLEQTNLNDNIKPKNDRIVTSLNLGYTPNPSWSFNGNYSNFDNTTKIRARENPSVFVDSLFLAQTTNSAGLSTTYRFGDKSSPSNISFSYNHQNAKSILDDQVLETANMQFNNFNLVFGKRITQLDLMVNASINYNISDFAGATTNTFAPTLNTSKSFFDRKLRSSLRGSYSFVDNDFTGTSNVLNLAWSNRWAVLKNQSIVFQLSYTNRTAATTMISAFNELYGSLRYSYQFNTSISELKKNRNK